MSSRDPGTPPGSPPMQTSSPSIGRQMPPPTGRMTTRLSARLLRNEPNADAAGSDVEMAGSRRASDVEVSGPSRSPDIEMASRRSSDVKMASRRSSDVEMAGSEQNSDVDIERQSSETTDSGRESDMDNVTPRRRFRAPIASEPEIDTPRRAGERPERPDPEIASQHTEESNSDAAMPSASTRSDVIMEAGEIVMQLGDAEPEWKEPFYWWTGTNKIPTLPPMDEPPHLTSMIYGTWYKVYVWPGGKPRAEDLRTLMRPPLPPSKASNPEEEADQPQVVPQQDATVPGYKVKPRAQNPIAEPLPNPSAIRPMKIPERLTFTPPSKLEAVLFGCRCEGTGWDWDQLAPVKVWTDNMTGVVMACQLVNRESDVDPALDRNICNCRATPLVDKFVVLPINEDYLLYYQRYNHLTYTVDHPNDAFLLYRGVPSMLEINHQVEGLRIKKRDGKSTFFANFN